MLQGFYFKNDPKQEIINKIVSFSRLSAAKIFAERKNLDLKSFLKIYSIKKIK
jgi:hypothetical protein